MQISIRPEEPVDYKPGHILGFEIAHPETGEGLKGPYTVTRCTANDCFDIIYRVIPDGRKTPFMEKIEPGATVRFGGKFGTPVADGMASDVDRVVGIATGAGIGPLVGYAEAELSSGTSKSIEIYCGFRDLATCAAVPSSMRSLQTIRTNSAGRPSSLSRWRARRWAPLRVAARRLRSRR